MVFYRRHLPHMIPENAVVFVTWNLKGAIPASALKRIQEARNCMAATLRNSEKPGATPTATSALREEARRIFRIGEEFLDQAAHGPKDLATPACADAVNHRILQGAEEWYRLYAHVVMPNHVHLLIEPKAELDRITGGIKRRTAREINKLQGQTGRVFWQDESFDHIPRGDLGFWKSIAYIERNPVAAGLCAREADWPWSSAAMRDGWMRGSAWEGRKA